MLFDYYYHSLDIITTSSYNTIDGIYVFGWKCLQVCALSWIARNQVFKYS